MKKSVVGSVMVIASMLLGVRLTCLGAVKANRAEQQKPQTPPPPTSPVPTVTPILLDTDIGTDIDDAFALALILRSPELDLVGITTVSGDTLARARLAARMLTEAGLAVVPVIPGEPGKPLPIEQTHWADGFDSPEIWRRETAVSFLRAQIERQPGKITLVAIGPLTNVGRFITQYPETARKLKRIVLMGGSIAHGYGQDPQPAAEYNIKSDVQAAQTVFSSGLPILMVPLDVTATHELDAAGRERIFTHGSTLTNTLKALYQLWGNKTPILFDPVAVAMVIKPDLCVTQELAIRVDDDGFTRVDPQKPPNATVALRTDKKAFFDLYLSRVAP